MKVAMIGIFSAAVLLAGAVAGFGTAKAGEADWWMEEGLSAPFDSSTAIDDEYNPGNPVETGRLPSGGETETGVEPETGSSYDYLPDRGD